MSLMRIEMEQEGGEEEEEGKQSDVALASLWQWQNGEIMHEGCDIDCGIT